MTIIIVIGSIVAFVAFSAAIGSYLKNVTLRDTMAPPQDPALRARINKIEESMRRRGLDPKIMISPEIREGKK